MHNKSRKDKKKMKIKNPRIKKVKNIYFVFGKVNDYSTGLIIELENGRLLAQQTTDAIMPYEDIFSEELNNIK